MMALIVHLEKSIKSRLGQAQMIIEVFPSNPTPQLVNGPPGPWAECKTVLNPSKLLFTTEKTPMCFQSEVQTVF